MSTNLKMIKFILVIISFAISSLGVYAQPSNNNCAGAIVLFPGSTCVPTSGTTAGATQSQLACSGSATTDVWYTFTATASALNITVAGAASFNAVVQLFSGTCGGSSLACANVTGNGGIETISSTTLNVGVQYWIRVHHFNTTAPSTPTFTICISPPLVEPPCDANSPEPSNSVVPCLNVPKICRLNGFCGTTQGYHATPSATTLTPYTVNTWPQLSAAFCGSIENNSFMRFEANASTVQLRVYGSCTSGTGIQMLAFSYVNPLDCGSGPVTSYGCFSPLAFPSPAAGIPLIFTGMVPGQIYYLMVDGYAGANCNYKIGADFGVQTSATVLPNTASMCLGSSLNLIALGGNGVYSWDPDPALSALVGGNITATPTSLGLHNFVVHSPSTDPACPGSSDTARVTVAAQPTPDAGLNDSICLGQPISLNGTLSNVTNSKQWEYVVPQGTTPTVVFTPNATSLAPSVMVSQPGVYKFIFRETNLICGPYRDTIEVVVLDPNLSITAAEPTCFGYTDGEITVNSAEAIDYSFDSQASWQLSNTGSNYASGTYEACVRDILGCVKCDSVIVPVPAQVTIVVSNDTIVCENGTALISGQGTVGSSFTYHWSQTSNLSAVQAIVSPTNANYYFVYAENQDGCLSDSDSILVSVLPSLSASLTPDYAICPGDNALINATASNGNGGPYNFSWSTLASGAGFTHSINETPLTTTSYQVIVTDACETTPVVLTMIVTVSPVPNPLFTILYDSICENAVFELYNTTAPAMVQTSLWQISDGQVYTNSDTILTNQMSDGNYDVSLTITSPDGCINTTLVNAALISMPRPSANFRYSPGTITAFSTTVILENLSIGNDLSHWTMQYANPAASSDHSPVTIFPEGVVDNYIVQLIAESYFGCTDTMFQIVEVNPEVILYAPNTFTPDDDEFNATWKVFIEGIDPSEFVLIIYNRWGEIVWKTLDPSADWDGTFKGEIVESGSYNWTIRAKDAVSSENHTWQGNVLIIK